MSNQELEDLRIVHSMHERKALMADLSDGFIALPGGIGTLEETTEIWTWNQLGIITKPCGLLNAGGFFDPFVAFLDHICHEKFMKPEHRKMLLCAPTAHDILEEMGRYTPSQTGKWINK